MQQSVRQVAKRQARSLAAGGSSGGLLSAFSHHHYIEEKTPLWVEGEEPATLSLYDFYQFPGEPDEDFLRRTPCVWSPCKTEDHVVETCLQAENYRNLRTPLDGHCWKHDSIIMKMPPSYYPQTYYYDREDPHFQDYLVKRKQYAELYGEPTEVPEWVPAEHRADGFAPRAPVDRKRELVDAVVVAPIWATFRDFDEPEPIPPKNEFIAKLPKPLYAAINNSCGPFVEDDDTLREYFYHYEFKQENFSRDVPPAEVETPEAQ
ncbi:MAG: hypothetical protein MHM6MM_002029 [Cercozoa sp. M6MM]